MLEKDHNSSLLIIELGSTGVAGRSSKSNISAINVRQMPAVYDQGMINIGAQGGTSAH